jgi:hypothetical protein
MPQFSVVVPTRNRPDLLDFCLGGLAAQTFDDVEVVVSDNPTDRPADAVFERWARPGWRYVRVGQPVPMHENFERACAEARGDYVAVVIDKTVLHPSALAVVARALTSEPEADIVTWWNEGYDPVDEAREVGSGRFAAAAQIRSPALYDPVQELARRFANVERRGVDPVHYYRGKIVFGAYSRALLERITAQTGRVFYPLAPDYTSMVPACILARRALDVGRPLLVSYNSVRSNGRLQSIDPRYAREFIEAADPAIVEQLPIPGLYSSQHNVVAYDLASAAARCPPGSAPALDHVNLVHRAREDLEAVEWSDTDERELQYSILEAAEARLHVAPSVRPGRRGLKDAVADAISRVRPVERLAYWVAERTGATPRIYASPLEAALAADRHYTSGLREYAPPS